MKTSRTFLMVMEHNEEIFPKFLCKDIIHIISENDEFMERNGVNYIGISHVAQDGFHVVVADEEEDNGEV